VGVARSSGEGALRRENAEPACPNVFAGRRMSSQVHDGRAAVRNRHPAEDDHGERIGEATSVTATASRCPNTTRRRPSPESDLRCDGLGPASGTTPGQSTNLDRQLPSNGARGRQPCELHPPRGGCRAASISRGGSIARSAKPDGWDDQCRPPSDKLTRTALRAVRRSRPRCHGPKTSALERLSQRSRVSASPTSRSLSPWPGFCATDCGDVTAGAFGGSRTAVAVSLRAGSSARRDAHVPGISS